jgi:biopolymer transport protein TolQ
MTDKLAIPTQEVGAGGALDSVNVPAENFAAGAASLAHHDLSMTGLFMQADIVVKLVILMLVASSIISWTIIFSKLALFSVTKRKITTFLDAFWNGRGGKNMEEFYNHIKFKAHDPLSRIFVSGMFECFEKGDKRNHVGRAERALTSATNREIGELEKYIGFLATVGSAAPFVGLFGTVWGIMNSFQSIAMTQNTTLAVVAPGIAEALFATAIGLFAAIPAVIFYNRFNSEVTKISNEINDFADELVIYIEREIG